MPQNKTLLFAEEFEVEQNRLLSTKLLPDAFHALIC